MPAVGAPTAPARPAAPAGSRPRMSLATTGLLLAAALACFLLSDRALQQHLSEQAFAALETLRGGATPFDWRFRSPRELVRGGTLEGEPAQALPEGLAVELDGHAVQLSLNLDGRAIDPLRYPRLYLALESSAPLSMRLLAEALPNGRRLLSPALPLQTGSQVLRLPLSLVTGSGEAAPGALSALVLHVEAPPGTRVLLRRARIEPGDWVAALDWPPARQPLPRGPDALSAAAQAYGRQALPWPIFELDPRWQRPERALADIDAVRELIPAAIVLPAQPHAVRPPAQAWPTFISAALLFAWGCFLLLLRLRPEPRRHWPDLLVVFVPGLWLVLSGQFAPDTPTWASVLIAMSLAYGLSLLPAGWAAASAAPSALLRVWGLPLLASLALALLLAMLAARLDTAELPPPDAGKLLRYALWVAVQQALLGPVLCRGLRADLGWPAPVVAALAATIFALLHLPNLTLALLTLLGGWLWALHWLRYGRWLPLALSHWIAALACFRFLPEHWLRSAEVGSRFFM